MNPSATALWYIESNFAGSILTLDEIAEVCGVSRFHLSRAFAAEYGCPVMRYVRGRRLTEAARMLAAGAPDILEVALEAGYGSHEAFTRAFREEFGRTPEEVRERVNLGNLPLMEPIRMNSNSGPELAPPVIVDGAPLLLAGLSQSYTDETSAGIPAQWQRFVPHLGSIRGQTGDATFGVCTDSEDSGRMNYLAGVEVTSDSGLAPELTSLRIPAQRYAVFKHSGHVSTIKQTWASIWNSGLPGSGYVATGGPMFERYGATFDPRTGNGGFEIWIPVRERG